ncbi:hypothetical protein Poly51_07140 [Rubripirellula tenax]|uniref:PEP-CTERM protein-sorting domain-containing protein n=1 Tax=Rubripirellula tenax TaxID=2528015 RepID=A0A5C6FG73_9BACT|nr:hypothetical protein [Rubripirellula tenax]TWU60438.1 hypothetical protein Poly51_07140 [Rubripirellula tenax]
MSRIFILLATLFFALSTTRIDAAIVTVVTNGTVVRGGGSLPDVELGDPYSLTITVDTSRLPSVIPAEQSFFGDFITSATLSGSSVIEFSTLTLGSSNFISFFGDRIGLMRARLPSEMFQLDSENYYSELSVDFIGGTAGFDRNDVHGTFVDELNSGVDPRFSITTARFDNGFGSGFTVGGGSLFAVAVPEPSVFALGCGICTAVLFRRKRLVG